MGCGGAAKWCGFQSAHNEHRQIVVFDASLNYMYDSYSIDVEEK